MESTEIGGQQNKGGGEKRRTRIRPLRGRQQAPVVGNGVKCSGNNEVFRCPLFHLFLSLALLSHAFHSLSYSPTAPSYIVYIFHIWNKCTGGLQDGCPASFFNYVQSPLGQAALEKVAATPLYLQSTLHFLSSRLSSFFPFCTAR